MSAAPLPGPMLPTLDQLVAMFARAESGEEHAELCRLESVVIAATKQARGEQ